jgi:iron complex outermembrane receptor protein
MKCAVKRSSQAGSLSQVSLAVSAALLFAAGAAHAEPAAGGQLEGIVVSGARPNTATYEAPTQGSLDAGEPQSVISQRFIENTASPAANYTDIINIAPSVVDTTPNGQGLAESLNLSIRGLQDGQFNVTFDGIPWNDSNDFTHHSTSYFTADSIGNVTVDRGPGTAAQVGNATFGGTVALESKDPLATHKVSPSLTLGSFRSSDYSLEVDTGKMAQAGDSRALLTLTSINSDGAMSNNALERKNAFFKYVMPIGADTTVTAVAMYNTLHQNVSQFGTTQAQLAQFGPSYSLSEVPSSDSYYGFNYDDIHTDFEYVDLRMPAWGGHLDNKVYTYAYYHKINETNDPSLAQGSEGLSGGTLYSANDVAGQKGFNNYRSWGDIVRYDHEFGPGLARAGLWFDYQWNDRALWNVDWTQGGVLDPSQSPATGGFVRAMHDTLTTLSPFVEYEYRPVEAITITPGVRFESFRRDVNIAFNGGNVLGRNAGQTWNTALPSLYAVDRLSGNWSAYAQAARGFLAPNLNVFYKKNTTDYGDVNPERTTNYQIGTTWKSERFTLAADAYYINFDNLLQTAPGAGGQVVFVSQGGAKFKGEEIEGTWVMGAGFSVYANASHNSALNSDGSRVLDAPDAIEKLGLIFDQGPYYASIIGRRIGSTVQNDGTNPNIDVAGYTLTDLALGYTIRNPGAGARDVKIKFTVTNLSDNRFAYFVYNTTLAGTTDYMTLPGRAYNIGVSADF